MILRGLMSLNIKKISFILYCLSCIYHIRMQIMVPPKLSHLIFIAYGLWSSYDGQFSKKALFNNNYIKNNGLKIFPKKALF